MTNTSVFTRQTKPERRVVVTGLGMISPLGNSVSENWQRAKEGQSGIGLITQFDTTKFDVKIAGEVKGFDPASIIEKKEIKKMDRFTQFAMKASQEAIQDSGLDFASNELLRARTGALIGVGIGGLQSIENQSETYHQKGPDRISPFFIPLVITNMAAGHVTIKYGLRGPNYSVTSACASGVHSIGEAARYIQDGTCDAMIAGGVESAITPLSIAGFNSMKALSVRNEDPTKASRPFDRGRDGFILSEAGGIVILEDYEHASRRGAKIYAELVGYGVSSDAYHMTSPPPDGAGAALAMKMAVKKAGINPDQVGYINAHGTSTPVGDGLETTAIKHVFGDHAKKLCVSSTKSMTGHALGAAGAIESIYTILALKNQIVPPTINLDDPSDDCDLDYVPHRARDVKIQYALNNSFGFGGTNACVIFSKI